MKPWMKELRGKQLEAFLGANGIRTRRFEMTQDLLTAACTLFEVPGNVNFSVNAVSEYIFDLGKKARSELVRKNINLISSDKVIPKAEDAPITAEGLEKMMAASEPQMIDGEPMDCVGELDIDPARLLRKVVSAVIVAGQAHVLYDFPEVLAFFGARIPEPEELVNHTGVDERMFEAKSNWPNLDPKRTRKAEAAS